MNRKVWIALLLPAFVWIGGPSAFAADEIKITTSLSVDNGNYKYDRKVTAYGVDQTVQAADMGVQVSVATVTNNINAVNVTNTPGYSFFRNLGTNNVFVTCTMRLEGGFVALLPLNTTNVTHFTTNGSSNLEYWINAK